MTASVMNNLMEATWVEVLIVFHVTHSSSSALRPTCYLHYTFESNLITELDVLPCNVMLRKTGLMEQLTLKKNALY